MSSYDLYQAGTGLKNAEQTMVMAGIQYNLGGMPPTRHKVKRPVVIYRSQKDIGKSLEKSADAKGDDIREYVSSVGLIEQGALAPDLLYGDKLDDAAITKLNAKIGEPVRSKLIGLKRDENYIKTKTDTLIADFKELAYLGVSGEALTFFQGSEMTNCFNHMIKIFLSGSGSTWEHTNDVLYREVLDHSTTQNFIKESLNLILKKLFTNKTNGNLEGMEFKPEMRGDYKTKRARGDYNEIGKLDSDDLSYDHINNNPLYDLIQQTIHQPVFDDFGDKLFGLGITIHDIWALKIQIEDYEAVMSGDGDVLFLKGNCYLIIYDNFGLDDLDIGPDKKPAGSFYQFWAWYILQHHDKFKGAYKPFINMITIPINIASYVGDHFFWRIANGWREDDGYVSPRSR